MDGVIVIVLIKTMIASSAMIAAIFLYSWIAKQLLAYAEPLAKFIGRTVPNLLNNNSLSDREKKMVNNILKNPINKKLAWVSVILLVFLIPFLPFLKYQKGEDRKPLKPFDKVMLAHIALSVASSPIAFLILQIVLCVVIITSAPRRAYHTLISSLEKLPGGIFCGI